MRFIVPMIALALVILPGCMTASLDGDGFGFKVEPVASLSRVKAGEAAAAEYADELGDALVAVAEQVGAAEEVVQVEIAQAKVEAAREAISLEDIYTSEWFYALLGALGVGEFGRRKLKQAKAELPDDYFDASEVEA